jgi:RHS repeat-associated protein
MRVEPRVRRRPIGNRYTYTGREYDETLALYHYRARMYDSVGGRFVSRDPIGYLDGMSLYAGRFATRGLDPFGLQTNPSENSPNDSTTSDGIYDAKYIAGIGGIGNLAAILGARCASCADKSSCTKTDCQNDASRIADAMLSAWKANYGMGPFSGPKHPQACGNWYCYNWSELFKDAFDRVGSDCFSASIETSQRPPDPLGKDKTRFIHVYLVITVGDDDDEKGKCSVTVDDGFADGNYVHVGNDPYEGNGPYRPIPPDDAPYYSEMPWGHVVPFPVE